MRDWSREVLGRLASLNLPPAREAEIVEEVAQHLEDRYQELVGGGATEDEARRVALEELSDADLLARGLRRVEQEVKQAPVVLGAREKKNVLAGLWRDTRYGLRTLARNPGITAVAVTTLALGIGLNTVIFSMVNGLLLRPPHVRHPEQIYTLSAEGNTGGDRFSYQNFQDIKEQASALFSDMAGVQAFSVTGLSVGGKSERMWTNFVSGNFFEMLGIRPAVGRFILPAEGRVAGADPVLVLGHSYWVRRFGGDPGVIGSSVTLDGQTAMVIGVVPEEFRGPYNIVELDAYAPIGMYAIASGNSSFFTDRRDNELRVLATLKPGVTAKQAEAALNVIAKRLASEYPQVDQGQIARVIPERLARPEPAVANSMPLVATIFLLMVGLVLLVACFNVANLLLARAVVREKEMAVRAAMGASRARLIRQMLTESILLAIAGAVGGALMGNWVIRVLERLRPLGDFHLRLAFSFDWRVFSYVAGVALAAGIVAGLAPALRISRANLNLTLREGGRGLIGGARRHRLRNGLVVAQVAGSLVVLVAAGLFTRSLTNAESIDLGYDPHNVLNLSLEPKLQGYDQPRAEAFFRELLNRAKALPGVESASLAFSIPLGYYGDGAFVYAEGQPLPPGKRVPGAGYNCVTPDYFSTLRMRILKGRAFAEADTSTSQPVAIVNQSMAERLWPGRDAIGRRFSYQAASGPFVSVVGLVRDAKVQGLLGAPGNFFYLPQTQNYKSTHVLQLHTLVPPQSLIVPAEALVRQLDPNLPVYDVMTMEQAVAGANGYFLFKVGAAFAASLGALGLLLAVVGVYGVVSYAASQRMHEIGIRMALGALPRSVLGLVMRQAVVLVGAGVGLGVLAGLVVSRILVSLLLGVPSYDPLTFTSVSALMLAVALLACYIPARRAARVDPMVALRYE